MATPGSSGFGSHEISGGLIGQLMKEISVDQTGIDPLRKSAGLYKAGLCQKNVTKNSTCDTR